MDFNLYYNDGVRGENPAVTCCYYWWFRINIVNTAVGTYRLLKTVMVGRALSVTNSTSRTPNLSRDASNSAMIAARSASTV